MSTLARRNICFLANIRQIKLQNGFKDCRLTLSGYFKHIHNYPRCTKVELLAVCHNIYHKIINVLGQLFFMGSYFIFVLEKNFGKISIKWI